jgi:periplasmic protein CpxP/Spy
MGNSKPWLRPEQSKHYMKLNKTLALVAVVAGSLLAGGALAQAQDSASSTNVPAGGAGKPRPRGAMNLDNLVKTLALTDDQKTNFQAAMTDYTQKRRDVRADDSLSTEDKRAKYKELRDNFNAKLKDILTPDQYTKWQKMTPGGRRRPAPTPPADGSTSTNAPATN